MSCKAPHLAQVRPLLGCRAGCTVQQCASA
jgi:hypothetical protein